MGFLLVFYSKLIRARMSGSNAGRKSLIGFNSDVVDGLFLPGLLSIVLLARYVGDVVIGMLAGVVFCALAVLAKKIVVPGTFS